VNLKTFGPEEEYVTQCGVNYAFKESEGWQEKSFM
jgi:hypothetical protein